MRIFTDKYGTKYADLVVGGKRRRVSLKTRDGKVAILRASQLADDRQARNEGKTLLPVFLTRLELHTKATRKKTPNIDINCLGESFLIGALLNILTKLHRQYSMNMQSSVKPN